MKDGRNIRIRRNIKKKKIDGKERRESLLSRCFLYVRKSGKAVEKEVAKDELRN